VNTLASPRPQARRAIGTELRDGHDPASPHVADGRRAGAAKHAGAVVAPREGRRQIHDVSVDKARPVELARDCGPAFHQYLEHTPAAQLVEHVAEIAAHAQGWLDAGRVGHLPEDHSERVAPAGIPDREGRVIRPNRPGAHEHRIALSPQPVSVGPRQWSGDPAAAAVGGGSAAVHGGGHLEHHPGPSGAAVLEIGGQLFCDLAGCHAHDHVDARSAKVLDAAAFDVRVRVLDADHNPADTCFYECAGTRWGTAVMGTWLEGHVGRCATGSLAGEGESPSLGMRTAGRRGGRLDRGTCIARDDHATDPWVGRRGRTNRGGDRHRLPHHCLVLREDHYKTISATKPSWPL